MSKPIRFEIPTQIYNCFLKLPLLMSNPSFLMHRAAIITGDCLIGLRVDKGPIKLILPSVACSLSQVRSP